MTAAGRPKTLTTGEFKYVYKTYDVFDFPDDQLIGRAPREVKEMARELAAAGIVIYPIITTSFEKALYLQDGVCRILGCRYLCSMSKDERAEFDIDFDPDTFKRIDGKEFKHVNPKDVGAWSIILNEQRSENEVAAFLRMRDLQESGDWDGIQELFNLNKAKFNRLMQLNNLKHPDEFIQGFQDGTIASTTLFGIAKQGEPRQRYLLTVLQDKGKITGTDLKEAREARAAAVLSAVPEVSMLMPQQDNEPIALPEVKMDLYVVINNGGVEGPFEGYHAGLQTKLENGGKLYRLVEIG